MRKQDLAEKLAKRLACDYGVTLSVALRVLDELVEIISETLIKNEAITIRGFAAIEPCVRKPRKCRKKFSATSKGEMMVVPARRDVRLKLYNAMKHKLNKQQKV